MTIGCCVGENTLYNDSPDRLKPFKEWGFDFVELPVSWLVSLDESAFRSIEHALNRADTKVAACNVFLPSDLAIVGPERDIETAMGYVEKAFERVHRVNCPIVVFGSGRTRRFPHGHPAEVAWSELRDFSLRAADAAARNEITVALEPLRYEESNVINSVESGCGFVDRLDHPHFKLLADTFHMEAVGEPLDILRQAAPFLCHVHTADTDRKHPGSGTYDHTSLFRLLREIDYQGAVSVECRWDDFDREAPLAARHLQAARERMS